MSTHSIGVVDLTKLDDEQRTAVAKLCLSAYFGEKCRFCLKQHDTLESLETVVFAGYHEHGRIACQSCWDAAPQEVKDSIEADRRASR